MKILLLITFISFFVKVNATNYYFSTSGDDSRTSVQAQNPVTPWRTLSKLNAYFISINAGDSILFKSGDVFYGTIIITKSGTSLLPIVLSSYGTGAKPEINGLTTLSSWTSLGGGIYQSQCSSCKTTDNLLTIDDVQKAIGRYPNTGYLKFESFSTTISITDNQLTGTPNWTGAEVIIRKNNWIMDRNIITSHSGNTITYLNSSSYAPDANGYGYFIQKDPKTLDQLGEWYFEPTGKNMLVYFGDRDPNSYSVKTSTIDTLIYLNHFNYITFKNLAIKGANVASFELTNSAFTNIQNCSIDFSGTNAINGSNPTYTKIENCSINHTNNNAIAIDMLVDAASNTLIRNNKIKNTALIPGMGKSGNGTYIGILSYGGKTIIEFNEIDSCGFNGIVFLGDSVLVKNNFVNYFCMTKDDGGGIYTWNDQTQIYSGQRVIGNIVLNGIGAGDGKDDPTPRPEGIYMDGYGGTADIEISGNTVAHVSHYGMMFNSAHHISVKNNTFFNNGTQFIIGNVNTASNKIKNLIVKNNVFFSKTTSQMALSFVTTGTIDEINLIGITDSNFYSRPLGNNYVFITYPSNEGYLGKRYNLKRWQSTYNRELNSRESPRALPEYRINNLIDSLYPHDGKFNHNIYPFEYNSIRCNTHWNNGGRLDGGAMQVSFASSPTTNTPATLGMVGVPLDSTKNYILKFSSLGTKTNRSLGIYLQGPSDPYNASTAKYLTITTTRTEHEILFSHPKSVAAANITFFFTDNDSTLWLDNMQFYEANVTVTNPDEYIRFEYNPTSVIKTVVLNDNYIGVDSTIYSQYITLQPYTSAILIKDQTHDLKLLPLQFLNFKGHEIGNRIDLEWEISDEVNTDYFEIQKSYDEIRFEKIGKFTSHNSNLKFKYTTSDFKPVFGKNYYRIKQVDTDGKYIYSKIIRISYSHADNIKTSPNPVYSQLRIDLDNVQNSQYGYLLVKTLSGNNVKSILLSPYSNFITIDMSSFPNATYIISLVYKDYNVSRKIVKWSN